MTDASTCEVPFLGTDEMNAYFWFVLLDCS